MKRVSSQGWVWGLVLVIVLAMFGGVGQASPALSGNVPMGSYVYEYLDKLDGMGLLKSMPPGARPYSRLQVAGWLLEIEKEAQAQKMSSGLVRAMLADLRREFAPELSRLSDGKGGLNSWMKTLPQVREWTFGAVSYDGESSGYPPGMGRGTWQPLNRNGQGYRWNQGMNAYGSFVWEGAMGPDAWISLTPRFGWGEKDGANATLQSGYVKLRSGNTEFLVGKDAMAWGQGKMGNLLLSDNATPLTRVQLSNIEPLRYRGLLRSLGPIHAKVFVAGMEDRRYWSGGKWNDIEKPGLYGMRLDFQPSADFAFGIGYTSMFGGTGVKMGFNEYLSMLLGKTNFGGNDVKNEFANGIAGIDFRWRIPRWNGMSFYSEIYTEDNLDFIGDPGERSWSILGPRIGFIGGISIPRLTSSGNWDLNLEFASTGKTWYVHNLYTGGYTYGGQILGDPMGGDAHRYSMRLNHYLDVKTQIGLRLDRINQGISQNVQQRTNAIALSLRHRLSNDLMMEFTGGLASRDNADFVAGRGKKNKFVGWSIRQQF